ncbi:hypothetical protein [Sporosarcina sp. BP05]|uniref:hypothetical protein n=1 Tax=Sporosarcina sp. BP05 TaxID=2758726 RepID=UPI0016457480|nr:hypothetical protein [Sporosarcina sp. BP05]
MVAKGVWVPMGAVILTHISTSSNDLLFMHMKSGLFEDFLVYKCRLSLGARRAGHKPVRLLPAAGVQHVSHAAGRD